MSGLVDTNAPSPANFENAEPDRIRSTHLALYLNTLHDRPWPGMNHAGASMRTVSRSCSSLSASVQTPCGSVKRFQTVTSPPGSGTRGSATASISLLRKQRLKRAVDRPENKRGPSYPGKKVLQVLQNRKKPVLIKTYGKIKVSYKRPTSFAV